MKIDSILEHIHPYHFHQGGLSMWPFLDLIFFNNTVLDYLIFLISTIVTCVFIRIIEHFLIKRLHAWVKKTKPPIYDRLIQGIKKYLLPIAYFVVIYLNTQILHINPTLTKIIDTVILSFITVIGTMFLTSVVVFIFSKYTENKAKDTNKELALKWIVGIVKTIIWGVAFILFLDNIGVKINSLIAGLGISGVALAFAAQFILADIFCFFTIFFDRPFEIGDFIVSGEQMGTVEHIGLKTTRLRALSGEQLIFSNTDLTGSRIRNYKTLEQRRVLFTLGVTYDTSYEKLKEIPSLIKSIIDSVHDTTFGRTHFYSYGPYSLNFEIAYYVLSNDYDKYMDINQEINLLIKEVFDRRQIQFALPTQTMHVQRSPFQLASDSERREFPE